MSHVTTHPTTTDEISSHSQNKRSDVEINTEPAVEESCDTLMMTSERKKKKKKKRKEEEAAELKLDEEEHPREEYRTTGEDRCCTVNDTPNQRQTDERNDEGTFPKDCPVSDTPVSDKRKDKKRKEKKRPEANNNQELIDGVNTDMTAEYDKPPHSSQTSDGEASALQPASVTLLDSTRPVSKKREEREKRKEKEKNNTEPDNALNIENVQQSHSPCEEPSLTIDRARIKKRKRDTNVENKDNQNVEGCAPKPNLMFDTPRKKKRKKDKEKLIDENTEPVGGGEQPQAQVRDGGSTTRPVGLLLDLPTTSTKKDNKLKENKGNSETGDALNSEDLQRSEECEEPSLTSDAPQIKKKKKVTWSEDSQKNDSQNVAEERSADLTSSNVLAVTSLSDTPSQKRKDKKVKKKKSESNQNLNDEVLENLPSQTRDVSPSPVIDTAMIHAPTPEKKKRERKEKCESKKNQELNVDLESTERDDNNAPAGETSHLTVLKKRKKDKKEKKQNKKKIKKKKKTKTDKSSKEKKSISWSKFFSIHKILIAKHCGPRKRWMVCEGFQFILKHQAEALLKLGVNPHFKDVLCGLWRMYLQTSRQAYTNKPIRHSHLKRVMRSQGTDATMDSSCVSTDDRHTDKDMFTDTENENSGEETDDSECGSVISGSFDAAKYLTQSRRRAGSLLSMRKTLALCYLALVWCREGITLSELLRFVSEGHIPYVNAHDLFPEDMKPTGRDTLLFRATSIPLYKDVHKEAQTMAIFMALPRFPPVSSRCGLHPAMLSLRYLTHINLPDQLYEWVCWVMEKTGLSDESLNTLDPLNSPLPRYDLQTAAAIVVTMKLLFGFNDRTEWVLSSKAGDQDKGHPEEENFNLRRWYRLLQTALTRATHARKQFIARKQWTHKKALLKGKKDSVILKHRRVVEQLQASFETVSGRAAGPQPSSPSSFIFRWGSEEEEEEDRGGSDGPSLHEQSLNSVWTQTRGGLRLYNTNYWHADLKDCKKMLRCKSHYKELKSSDVLPRSYVWLLELFSFLLDVRAATLHEEVKGLERRLFKRRIYMKRSLRHRRWRYWWRTRGHLVKVV